MSKNDLALLVLDSSKEFGEKVEQNLLKLRGEKDKHYISKLTASRFTNDKVELFILLKINKPNVFGLSKVKHPIKYVFLAI